MFQKIMDKNKNHSVLLFFIDGLGIGSKSVENPFTNISGLEPLSHFKFDKKEIIYNGVIISTDPRLGVEGRPQSASGQTTILDRKKCAEDFGLSQTGISQCDFTRSYREVFGIFTIKK